MKALQLRPYILFIWVALVLLVESCKDTNETPQPVIPIPTEPCSLSVNSGYVEKFSCLPREKMKAFIHSNKNTEPCRLDVYDIHGNVAFSVRASLKTQTVSNPEPSIHGFGYSYASEFEIPSGTKSGIYLIEKKIPIIIRTTQSVDLTIVYPSNTDNAYAIAGGKSLYSKPKSSIVSFHRPMELQWQAITGLKWFSTLNNLSINYISDRDMDDYASIQNSKIIVLVGHSEYWTRKARKNFDRFVEAGKHAIILSGNTMWWQVRYSNHQMICYKSFDLNSEQDPITDPLLNTVEWDRPSLQYSILSSIGADFPRGGYGLQSDKGWDGYKIVSPLSPLLEGLNLKKGDIISLPSGEYDGAPIASFTANGYPEIDNSVLNFHRIELVGFDKGARGGKETVGTFIVFQKTPLSGIVVNGASYDWCSHRGMGGRDGDKIKKITLNAISKLLNKQKVFSN
ncbi:MAG: hypothetical protein HOP30_06925 [Cyclobacteriaceae bacterium]|nr:hypothetical protein [Cyclobacteriaceae bacterium]